MALSLDSLAALIEPMLGGLATQAMTAVQGWIIQIQSALGANGWIVGIVVGLVLAKMVGSILRMIVILAVIAFALSKLGVIPGLF